MSPVLYAFLLVASVAVAYLVGRSRVPAPVPASEKPRVFGIREAQAAKRWVRERTQAEALLGVVVGVLGYRNTVAEDAAELTDRIDVTNANMRQDIVEKNQYLAQIRAEIVSLEQMIRNGQDQMADLKQDATLFSA